MCVRLIALWCVAGTDLGFTRDRRLKMRKSGKPDLRGPPQSVAVPDQRCTAPLRYALHRVRDTRQRRTRSGALFTFQTAHLVPAAHLRPGFATLASLTPNRGVGRAPRNVRVLGGTPVGPARNAAGQAPSEAPCVP